MACGWEGKQRLGAAVVAAHKGAGCEPRRYRHDTNRQPCDEPLLHARCLAVSDRPTQATTELLEKIIYRVETENGWDQALYNECIFFPSRPGYKVSAAQPRHHPPFCCVKMSAGHRAGHICSHDAARQ